MIADDEKPKPAVAPAMRLQCRLLGMACLLLGLALPLATAWMLWDSWPQGVAAGLKAAGITPAVLADVAWWRLLPVVIVLLAPVSLMAGALWHARRCMVAVARGEHFLAATVTALRRSAICLMLAGAAALVAPTLTGLLLTAGAQGQAVLTIHIGSPPLMLMLFSGLAWQMGRVLDQAVALAAEHAQIV